MIEMAEVMTGTQLKAIRIAFVAAALCTASAALKPPAPRIQPRAAVPMPEPIFMQKEEAALPMPA